MGSAVGGLGLAVAGFGLRKATTEAEVGERGIGGWRLGFGLFWVSQMVGFGVLMMIDGI